jgi:hypothetical protein
MIVPPTSGVPSIVVKRKPSCKAARSASDNWRRIGSWGVVPCTHRTVDKQGQYAPRPQKGLEHANIAQRARIGHYKIMCA